MDRSLPAALGSALAHTRFVWFSSVVGGPKEVPASFRLGFVSLYCSRICDYGNASEFSCKCWNSDHVATVHEAVCPYSSRRMLSGLFAVPKAMHCLGVEEAGSNVHHKLQLRCLDSIFGKLQGELADCSHSERLSCKLQSRPPAEQMRLGWLTCQAHM